MLRDPYIDKFDWTEKTLSAMQQREAEASEAFLKKAPPFGIFTYQDDLHAEELWSQSFYAQEEPGLSALHTTQDLRSRVLINLPAETALLSMHEGALLERMLDQGGTAELLGLDELYAAEFLVRRLWCYVTYNGLCPVLHLPDELLTPLLLLLGSKRFGELLDKVCAQDMLTRTNLYLRGVLPAQELVGALEEIMKEERCDRRLIMRFLRVSYTYVQDHGQLVLLHSALADPEPLLLQLRKGSAVAHSRTDELHSFTCDAAEHERPSVRRLQGLLRSALRPELQADEATEDLLLLAKQDAPIDAMIRVLQSMLIQHPTMEMYDALRDIHTQTPRWYNQSSPILN